MHRTTPNSDQQRIAALFARRQPTYRVADVPPLLGVSEAQLEDWIARGIVATERNDRDECVIPWAEIAVLALDEWTPRMIAAALQHEPNDIIPLLNQHRLIRISLPIYLIRLLDYLARVESATRHVPRNASDVIERILHDVANTPNTATIDDNMPGYAQALSYPYFTQRRTGLLSLRCRYCGISITEPGREVCHACEARHEPNEHLGEYGLPELEEQYETPAHQAAPSPQEHEPATRAYRRSKRRRRAATRRR